VLKATRIAVVRRIVQLEKLKRVRSLTIVQELRVQGIDNRLIFRKMQVRRPLYVLD
jgi:hypothetical protein